MDFLNVAVGYLCDQKHMDQYLLARAVAVAPVGSQNQFLPLVGSC
jgi:hypothetical protein